MSADRNAASVALIGGWIAYVALMMVHPTRLGGPALGHVSLNDAVHWTGLLILPLLLFGYLGLAVSLGPRRPLVMLALCALVPSMIAGMGAAIMSGLVMPQVVAASDGGRIGSETTEALRLMTFWLNQGFATVHYVFLTLGIGLLALAWPNRGLKIGGVLVAAGFLAWLATGTWGADVHSVLAVVAASAVWSIVAALGRRGLPEQP